MLRYDFFECGRGVVGDRPKNWGGGFFGVAVSFTPYPLNFCFMPLSIGLVVCVGWVGKWSGLGGNAFIYDFRIGREVLPIGQVGGYRAGLGLCYYLYLFLFMRGEVMTKGLYLK